jgi:hypothetical protein
MSFPRRLAGFAVARGSTRRGKLVRIGLVVAALVVGAVGVPLVASATTTYTSTTYYAMLNHAVTVLPNLKDDYPSIFGASITLKQGETRRIQEQLAVSISSTEGAEVDNRLLCLRPDGTELLRTSAGTNHAGSAAGILTLHENLLLHADAAGTYQCLIEPQTSDGTRMDYTMTVWPGKTAFIGAAVVGTFLKISSADEVGAQSWAGQPCQTHGDNPDCPYLGTWSDPWSYTLELPTKVPAGAPATWTAGPDVITYSLVGVFMVTSCPRGTDACRADQRGNGALDAGGNVAGPLSERSVAIVQTRTVFTQLYPDGSPCVRSAGVPHSYTISNSVHHLPLEYSDDGAVSPNCRGSRTFKLQVEFGYRGGNPFKLDLGQFNAIGSTRGTTTAAVPN